VSKNPTALTVGYTISEPFTQSRGKRLLSALGAQRASRYQTGGRQDSARSYEPLLFKGNDFSKTDINMVCIETRQPWEIPPSISAGYPEMVRLKAWWRKSGFSGES
jgi:hypothetical protein